MYCLLETGAFNGEALPVVRPSQLPALQLLLLGKSFWQGLPTQTWGWETGNGCEMGRNGEN